MPTSFSRCCRRPAVNAVMADRTALGSARPETVWLQMSTVGIDWTDRLAGLAGAYDVAFVDALFQEASAGRDRHVARACKRPGSYKSDLGAGAGRDRRRTIWLGQLARAAGEVGAHNWLVDLVESTAETLRFAGASARPGDDHRPS